ncbi:MAG TPA: hypothetical protein VIL71_23025, partial [Spirillospora sp.]
MNIQLNRTYPRGAALVAALALAMAGGTAAALPSPAAAQPAPVHDGKEHAKPSLRVAKVTARDDKSIDITFNKTLGSDILQFTAANHTYAGQFIKVSGGKAGGSDAALDGRALSEVPGTTVRPADTPDRRTLRVVLGDDVRLEKRSYSLWFDGAGDSLADLFFRAEDGGVLPGSSTRPVKFQGTAEDAAFAEIDEVRAVDARTVDVTFTETIWSGMPVGAYDGSDITLQNGDASVHPVYVEHLPSTEQRGYRLYFGTDLTFGASTTLTLGANLKLTTNAGRATEDVSAKVRGRGGAYAPVRITKAEVSAEGDRIELSFSRRVAKAGGLPVVETKTGVSGTNVTADQVRGLLKFAGLTTTSGKNVADVLRDDAAYFPNASSLVVKLDSGETIRRGTRGGVALNKGALTDVTGAASTHSEVVPVKWAPKKKERGTGFDPKGPDYLKVNTRATTVFQRYEYKLSDDGVSVRAEDVGNKVVGQTIKTIEVENKYIKAVFAPDYGARLLSVIYKP